jgi:uncharacterized membrane protein
VGAAIGVLGELVGDKLPQAPSRLAPAGLGGRLAIASAAGVISARGAGRAWLPAVLVACAAALASAKVGHDARAAAARRIPPLAAAAAEDAVALTLGLAVAHA